jgi:hypothetical protein
MKRFFRVRYLLVLIIALIVATGVLGFAAGNTVPNTAAGDGNGGISGYVVTNVKYNLETSDATHIASVTFDLAGTVAPVTVKAKLVSSSTTYASCSVGALASGVYPATCSFGAGTQSVTSADDLRIIALSN